MASQLVSGNHPIAETEDTLLERVRHGESAAFEALWTRHYTQVYRVVFNLVGSREEAEDLVQETFLTLFDQPPTLGPGAPLIAWLCRVALNRGYNALRGQQRAQQRLERAAETPNATDPSEEALRAEERALVRSTIAALPERQGQLLLLRYAGLSYGEIAGVLGIAASSVGTLLARAEKAFLSAYGGERTGASDF